MRVIFGLFGEEVRSVGVVVLRRGLRGEGRFESFGVCQLQRAVDFVGRDVIETLALIAFGQRFPVELGGLQQAERAHHVGAGEGEGVLDGAVHMAFGGQVDDAVHVVFLHELHDAVEVADVRLDEGVVRAVLDVLQVGQVAGVGQFVEVDDVIVRIFVHEQAHHVAADEPGAAGDDDVTLEFHVLLSFCGVSTSFPYSRTAIRRLSAVHGACLFPRG